MAHDDQDRVTALAGLYQAVACVMRIARSGSADTATMEPCIYSLFQIDAANVAAVYGPPGAMANGARQLVAQLTGQPKRDLELTRYVVSVIRLERKLSTRPDLMEQIGQGIAAAEPLRARGPLLDPELLGRFAELYSENLSPLTPRILVRGASHHLRNADNQTRIRAMLLAAIRSAMLWRQLGGTRWQILLGHKRLLAEARRYLDLASHQPPTDAGPRDEAP
ncbi:high frequency lysogenization protein HflD [uncultured Thiodictyon sp.]|uniref:high frequency lysogenization protein HflD n=1 Tax=uncultured Thiodictyon sp. TaxID=1846217 RepID=UPI0025E2AC35|nr:high frequency lysogenization protein HflD [uncultured Thiodictyon sp.]